MTYNILIIMRIVISISRIYSNIYLYTNIRFFLKVHFLYRDSWSDGQYLNISHVYMFTMYTLHRYNGSFVTSDSTHMSILPII